MPISAGKAKAAIFRFDQSGALLRKVMESAAVGMALVGADRRTIYVNHAYEAMLGLTPDALLGQDACGIVHADDRQLVELHLGQVLRGETEELRLECRMDHADGMPLWVLISGSLLRSETSGRPLYAIVQVINIDRQKRAEAALAENESRWNFALESAGQGVWDHDIRRDDMYYSRMWRRMRGIPDDEHVDPAQDKWLARVHPDDVPRILATVNKQDRGEDGFDTLEYRERHRDGHWIWILSRGRPVEWDADGNPLRTVGTDTDITRLKLAEAALAEEKERFRVTLHSIGDGVISTDAEETIVFMNPAAEAMTDRFKPVNDTAGHAAGDALLQKVAQAIRLSCRSHDFAARLGGDEFVVLLTDCPLTHARHVGQKIVDAVGGIDFIWNGVRYRIGASVGIATVSGDPARDPLTEADAACYSAKAAGRGRVALG